MGKNYFGSLTTALVTIGLEVARMRAAVKTGTASIQDLRKVEEEEASLRRLWDQSFFGKKGGVQ